MTINFITPTFNAASFISQTADSILSIKNDRIDLDIKWILVDNNSTDDLKAILESKKYKTLDFSLLVGQDNGIYDAMNKGLDFTDEGHVLFLGAGDKILKLPKNIDSQVVYYGTTIVDHDRYFVSSVENYVFNEFNSLHHQSMLTPVSFHKHFNTDYKICADYAHNIEMLIEGREFRFDSELLSYHLPSGASSDLEKTKKECQMIQQKVLEMLNTNILTNRI
jgi:glycosyltransferase involved in cell wall biosynthesis